MTLVQSNSAASEADRKISGNPDAVATFQGNASDTDHHAEKKKWNTNQSCRVLTTIKKVWVLQDSNLRPTDYESVALTS